MQNAKLKQHKQLINDKELLTQVIGAFRYVGKGSSPRQQRIDEYFPAK
ncbi:hypothetical protein J8M21_00755 [Pseudoalteromonas luteoviolacea]|nr:hypothetical protein [Pseudoalteromonas luteoviolacea]MBQ4875729.1 hypothetical protein [Pseudoalteromonas luteoviolacea]MBQ4904764.1 hypothetical protein [Pseudoalteromonas luteoviolacea]